MSSHLKHLKLTGFMATLLAALIAFSLSVGPAHGSSPGQIPTGLSAADWNSIRAMLPPNKPLGAQATPGSYIKASNTEAYDQFGFTIAMDGDTLVVGANQEGSNATGVNGDQADNSASTAGAVYVFVRSGGVWSQQAYLKASNTAAGDNFGTSVAISGDTLVVGAYAEDSNATGVNGDQANNSAGSSGAAYVFVRSGGVWSQQAYLKASNTGATDSFGASVAVSGDTVVASAMVEDSAATGVDGDQADNSATNAGAAYSFTLGPDTAGLALTTAVSPSSAQPGQALTYTIAFTNTGAATATGVIITDTLAAAIANPNWSSSGVTLTPRAGQTYAWTAPDLAQNNGGVITLTGVLTSPLAAGSITNTVTISSAEMIKTAAAVLTVSNVAPVAHDDNVTTTEDVAVTLSPLTNDSDANGDSLTVTQVGSPANGTAVISGTTQVVYTPTLNYLGTDVFTYTTSDGLLDDTATITVTVSANAAPTSHAGSNQTVTPTVTVQLNGSASSDPDNDGLTYGWAQTGGSPQLTLSHSAAISPTFTASAVGVFTFTLTVTDSLSQADSDEAVITVANDADGDGITDSLEGTGDTDMDGTPDYEDADSDSDGALDKDESATDTDSDGIPDYLESNTNDADGDATPDYQDTDSDNDGTLDSAEAAANTDSDGIPDRIESNINDADTDTATDYQDTDSDGDGKLDSAEGYLGDVDGDGIVNYLDAHDSIVYYFPIIYKH